ncbi:MAG: galactokinase [Acidobacteria bacterium]|nr:galactokinase [Acidobacteriota bacterium]
MIITRSPLRISLGGGGTDLPSYYLEHGGFLIAAAIDKYVHITLHETFRREFLIKYSKLEVTESVDAIQHPIIREALRLVFPQGREPDLEISSMADIPAGTGLGSSGSFTTALLQALYTLDKQFVSRRSLAENACHIEIDVLKEPIGKQDQFIAAYGGLTCFTFDRSGEIHVEPLRASQETLVTLEDNLALFFTGFTRSASNILKDQDTRSKQKDASMIDNLHFVKQLGFDSRDAFEKGDLGRFAEIMDVHWQHKKKRSSGMSNAQIDEWYAMALQNGALGGKVIGAGGGGFLMFYCENKTKLRHAMARAGLREVRVRFDFAGTTVVSRS